MLLVEEHITEGPYGMGTRGKGGAAILPPPVAPLQKLNAARRRALAVVDTGATNPVSTEPAYDGVENRGVDGRYSESLDRKLGAGCGNPARAAKTQRQAGLTPTACGQGEHRASHGARPVLSPFEISLPCLAESDTDKRRSQALQLGGVSCRRSKEVRCSRVPLTGSNPFLSETLSTGGVKSGASSSHVCRPGEFTTCHSIGAALYTKGEHYDRN